LSVSAGPKSFFVLTAALAAFDCSMAARAQDAAVRHAEPARLAAQSLLIAIAAAGERLVAVGDRGIIVLSDDRGASWVQASEVPTQALLTGVCFLDAQRGIAVGHDEVILTSADAGRTWKRTHYDPQAQRPLLDVWCGRGGHAIAVGAYSAYLKSEDGGASWNAVRFTPAPRTLPAPAREGSRSGTASHSSTAPDAGGGADYHLNRIVSGDGDRLYMAGEAGHLYASDDGGGSWRTLNSPYEGSFFGMLPLAGDTVLAFGLRGNLFRSTDGGSSWQKIDTGTVAMLTGGTRFDANGVAVVGLSGVVLVSRDGGHTFTLQQLADRAGLSAAWNSADARLAAVGENGAKLINPTNTAPGSARR
jgi:photosystem II stability/assembly factor-like uncharacterized protein